LGDGIMASPIVSGNKLFIRTLSSLHCISVERPEVVADKQPQPRL
jgi:hypothetical protein